MAYLKGVLPVVAMIVVQIGEVAISVLVKQAMTKGIGNLAYVVYCNALGTLILAFCYLFAYRKKRPPLTFSLVCNCFFLGLLGNCLVRVFSTTGIGYSSPTLASAFGNLIPAVTFILAVTLGMENIAFRSRSTQAKVLGTLVLISGALLVTLYKGPPVSIRLTSPSNMVQSSLPSLSRESNWALGALFLSATCLLSATWNVHQATVIAEYPEKLPIVFFSLFFGTVQCAIMSLFLERDRAAWILHSGSDIFSVLYTGIFGGIFRSFILAWCIGKKGPFFVALFKPLGIAIAVFMEIVFLSEDPYLGRLIGASVIVVGFYTVMWGKAKEGETDAGNVGGSDTSDQREPLLSDV